MASKPKVPARKVYWMDRLIDGEGALIRQQSHDLFLLRSGAPHDHEFTDEGPVVFVLDEDLRNEAMPTFFTQPALVTTRAFYKELQKLGLDNLQVYPAIIEDPVDGTRNEEYVYINVIGLVACADMAKSEAQDLGEDMTIIDKVVLKGRKVPDLDFFLLAEDPGKVLVSERVQKHFSGRKYKDVVFEELPQT